MYHYFGPQAPKTTLLWILSSFSNIRASHPFIKEPQPVVCRARSGHAPLVRDTQPRTSGVILLTENLMKDIFRLYFERKGIKVVRKGGVTAGQQQPSLPSQASDCLLRSRAAPPNSSKITRDALSPLLNTTINTLSSNSCLYTIIIGSSASASVEENAWVQNDTTQQRLHFWKHNINKNTRLSALFQ